MSKESEIPMFAIGNDELMAGDYLPPFITCPNCGEQHKIEESTPPALQWYKCGDDVYLAGINGKSIMDQFKTGL